jgi:hypothetical protein
VFRIETVGSALRALAQLTKTNSLGLMLRSVAKQRVSKHETAPSFETPSLSLGLLRMRRRRITVSP